MPRKTYPIDLNDQEWAWIEPLIPAAKTGGRKRHLLVDTLGLMWGILVTEADITDREGALRLLLMVRGIVYHGQFVETVQRLCARMTPPAFKSCPNVGLSNVPLLGC
jgi:transposase